MVVFYHRIVERIANPQWLPSALVTLSDGPLSLTVSALGMPLTRELIQDFCNEMAEYASRGWLPFYEVQYIDDASGPAVAFALQLQGQAVRSRSLSSREAVPRVVPDETSPLLRSMSNQAAKSAFAHVSVPRMVWAGASEQIEKRVQSPTHFKVQAMKIHLIILPVAAAVRAWAGFFESVKARVLDEKWSPSPSSSLFTISQGDMQLTVSSLGGAVPMELLHFFAGKMLQEGSRGWLPVFDLYYVDDATGITVAIALRMLNVPTAQFGLPGPSKRSVSRASHDYPTHLFPRHSIFKRGAHHFSSLNFKHLAMITPVSLAASFLEDFYDLIALKIETGVWNSEGPLHFVTFTRWNFHLSFYSYEEAVPWDFIQNFAIEMSDYAAKGFTTAFEATFQANKASREVYVTVALKLMDTMQQSGDGSSESTSGPMFSLDRGP